jgi:hypothetical protein
MSSKAFDRVVIGGTVLLTLCAVPFFLRYENTHKDWSAESSAAIASLSEGEREDLAANFSRLQNQLTDEKRLAIQAIHSKVTTDPDFSARLESYHDWLRELGVVDRDSIRSASTAEKKVAVIQTLMADSEEKRNGFFIDAGDRYFGRKGEDFVKQLQEDLKDSELSPLWITNREYGLMVDVFVSVFPDELKTAFSAAVREIDEDLVESEKLRLRTAAMRSVMMDYFRKSRDRSRGSDKRRSSITQIPDGLPDQAFAVIEDSEKREKLKALAPEQKKVILSAIRIYGLNPFQPMQRYKPDDRAAQDYYASLTRDQKIKLMAMPTNRSRRGFGQRERLDLMFIEQNEDAPEDIRSFAASILSQIDNRRDARSGRGGRPRGGDDRGPRGGGDDRDRGKRRGSKGGGPGRGPGDSGKGSPRGPQN